MTSEEEQRRHDHSAEGRHHGRQRRAPGSASSPRELALDLQADDEEEDGHQPVVDQVAEVLREDAAPHPEAELGVPEIVVARARASSPTAVRLSWRPAAPARRTLEAQEPLDRAHHQPGHGAFAARRRSPRRSSGLDLCGGRPRMPHPRVPAGQLLAVLLVDEQIGMNDHCTAHRTRQPLCGSHQLAARAGSRRRTRSRPVPRNMWRRCGGRALAGSAPATARGPGPRSTSLCHHTAIPKAHSECDRYIFSPYSSVIARTRSWHSIDCSVMPLSP